METIKVGYTKDTILKEGQYKFFAIKDIPSDYLLWWYDNYSASNGKLKKYIEENLESIKLKGTKVPIYCNKVIFPDIKSVQKRLMEIKRDSTKEKIPQRYYKCKICGGYHLTSIKRMNLKNYQ